MKRIEATGRCIHCLNDSNDITSDHIFPKSWYPASSNENQYKWQAPSCRRCNHDYGKIEKELMIRFAFCLDPDDPACSSIVEKGLRAIDPTKAKNSKDRKARELKRKQIQKELLIGRQIPTNGIYPKFEPDQNVPIEEQGAIKIRREHIEKLAKKIVRGIFYLEDDAYIDDCYEIAMYVLNDTGAEPLIEILNKFGTVYAREPGIVVNRAVVPEDLSSIFSINVWGRFCTYATVTKRAIQVALGDAYDAPDPSFIAKEKYDYQFQGKSPRYH